jgi:hypothetical protein
MSLKCFYMVNIGKISLNKKNVNYFVDFCLINMYTKKTNYFKECRLNNPTIIKNSAFCQLLMVDYLFCLAGPPPRVGGLVVGLLVGLFGVGGMGWGG